MSSDLGASLVSDCLRTPDTFGLAKVTSDFVSRSVFTRLDIDARPQISVESSSLKNLPCFCLLFRGTAGASSQHQHQSSAPKTPPQFRSAGFRRRWRARVGPHFVEREYAVLQVQSG